MPGLPGTVLVLAGLILAAWMDGFSRVGAGSLAVLVGLTLLAYAADFIAGALGVKRSGASPRAAAGAGLGALVGLFFGIAGVLVGPFLGAVLGELSLHGNLEKAGRAGIGAWLGMVVGTAVKVSLVFMMIAVFLLAWYLLNSERCSAVIASLGEEWRPNDS